MPKLTLNLNEQNELAFKISIEGTSTDVDATKPNIRFLVREAGKDTGWIYPTTPGDDGFVTVNIQSSDMFSENKEYSGKLEVILGNHYFVPAEVEMEFIKPLKVEAAVVTNRSTISEEAPPRPDRGVVSVDAVQIRSNKGNSPIRKTNKKPAKRKWDDLSEAEKRKVKKLLIDKKKKSIREAKELAKRKEEQKRRTRLLEEKELKDKLKRMMASSLFDEEG